MKRKKILHIVESFGSGIFSFLVDLINGTDDEFEITVAYGRRSETLADFKKYFSDKVKFIEVKNFTRSINFEKYIRALKEIDSKQLLKENGIVIIETDEPERDIREIELLQINFKMYDLRKYGRASLIFLK